MSKTKVWWIAMVIGCVIACPFFQLYAQETNLHCKWVNTNSKILILDSLLVSPETIEFQQQNVAYAFDINTSALQFTSEDLPDSLFVCYRTYPDYFSKVYQHRTYAEYDSLAPFKQAKSNERSYMQKEELFSTEGIYKSGSLSRGVSFGNSRSLGVTSSLNFQMEGKLTDNLNIRANITDQNIPFQPEGNTQQLREFDNVSIEVYNETISLRAGDIVLKNDADSYFLKYYKNVQGGQINLNYAVGKSGMGKSSATVSAAKGQFADITITVQEGVQGPYKLRGPNGEQFVIVLANSENIYLDGQRLERGYNQDYVIDYNLGEITFNPSVLITRFSRIRATYEYSDQNYSRSIISTNHSFQFGKTAFTFNHYQEKDSKNNPLAFELADEDKLAMSLAGEENLPIEIAGESETEFNENTILYKKSDTVNLDGTGQSIFVFSRDSSQMLYRVTFSNVGFGKGDYNLLSNTVNGRVFEWVSPENGESQGNYAAVLFVPAPNKKQMTTIGAEVALSPYSKVYSELAISNHDLNLFSDIGNEDNSGMAIKSGFEVNKKPINFLNDYKLSSSIDFEHDGKNFNAIDRFRYIEYDRDWSFDPKEESTNSADNIFNFSSTIEKNRENKLAYRISRRNRGDYINGLQQQVTLNKRLNHLQVSSGGSLLNNKKLLNQSNWKKAHGEIALNKYFIVPGYRYELDQNELKRTETDSVISSAMNYISHQFYLQNNDTLKSKFRVEYIQRKDHQPVSGIMDDFTSTNTTRANFNSDIGKSNHLDLTFTYRTLKYLGSFADNPNEETVLGKINWNGAFLDNHVRSEMSYATSSSREILREFIFVPVVSGEGTHTWRDLNEDGIQDVYEFFESINFDERNYIKLYVPTDNFISAFNNLFNLNLSATMPKKWKNAGGIREIISRFSSRSSININKKNTDNSLNSRFNPFQLNTEDEDLIFVKDAIRNTLFYNRSNPGFGFDLGYFAAHSKQLISSGIDSRNQHEWTINGRKQITSELSVLVSGLKGEKENLSDFFQGKNYVISIHTVAPQLVWQPTSKFRVTGKTEYKRKENINSEVQQEFSKITSLLMAVRWNKALKSTMDGSFKFTSIDFSGEENSPAGYELLEALRPGSNFIWNFSYRQKLSNGLQVSLSYDGRKSIEQRVIHQGRMQVTALF
ncbi:hypothetical protein [Reichenbachiella sp. MALMAid0571]|uniref:hypothetical protein n=1 Tax=Reichenbachiella sp. MALMAid0571 TaxID=3143939 RepID=UPI0032DFBD41